MCILLLLVVFYAIWISFLLGFLFNFSVCIINIFYSIDFSVSKIYLSPIQIWENEIWYGK
jgi:hypothetical protein